jgi:hypothetical protein
LKLKIDGTARVVVTGDTELADPGHALRTIVTFKVTIPTGTAFKPTVNKDSGIPDPEKYCTILDGTV